MNDYKLSKNPQQSLHYSSDSFMKELDKRVADIEEEQEKPKYDFLSLEQVVLTEYPKEQWLVNRMIPKDGITCLGGLPATMKSYFSNYLALCIAEGKPVFGMYATEPVNILFIDKENKLARIKDRFLRLNISTEVSKRIFFLNSNFLIDNEHDLAAVCAFIKDHEIKLTFIDTLIRVHNRNENEASEINKVFIAFKEMMLSGSGICFLHHFNKRGAFGASIDVRDQLRGSGDILAMVDSFIALSKKENFIEVEQAKSRDEVMIPKFLMQPVFEETKTFFNYIREVENDERIESVLLGDQILSLLTNNSYTRKYLIEKLESKTVSLSTIDRALRQLKNEGKISSFGNSTKGKFFTVNKTDKIL